MSADPLLSRAQELEKAGDSEAAASLYATWLKANAGASGFVSVFSAYFSLEQDLPTLLSASEQFLATGHGLPGASVQLVRVARLFELSGRIKEARDCYLEAYAEGGPDSALVSALLLSREMNDAASIAAGLSKLKDRGEPAALLLEAVASFGAGDDASARSALFDLAKASNDPSLSLKALWVLYAAANGDAKAQASVAAALAARFPGAPETAIATSGGRTDAAGTRPSVLPFPTPDAFASVEAVGPQAAEPPTAEPPAAAPFAGRYAVQAGSFQVKENADYLAADLAKAGFSPVVKQETVQGKDMFKVLAGTGLDGDQARALLSRLSEAGFSGFQVAEK